MGTLSTNNEAAIAVPEEYQREFSLTKRAREVDEEGSSKLGLGKRNPQLLQTSCSSRATVVTLLYRPEAAGKICT